MMPGRRPTELTEEQKQAWHETPFVHVFGQPAWHEDVVIVCNRAGLHQLRELFGGGITSGSNSVEVFVNDSEGYDLCVELVNDEEMDELAVPYVSEVAVERSEERWARTKQLFVDCMKWNREADDAQRK